MLGGISQRIPQMFLNESLKEFLEPWLPGLLISFCNFHFPARIGSSRQLYSRYNRVCKFQKKFQNTCMVAGGFVCVSGSREPRSMRLDPTEGDALKVNPKRREKSNGYHREHAQFERTVLGNLRRAEMERPFPQGKTVTNVPFGTRSNQNHDMQTIIAGVLQFIPICAWKILRRRGEGYAREHNH